MSVKRSRLSAPVFWSDFRGFPHDFYSFSFIFLQKSSFGLNFNLFLVQISNLVKITVLTRLLVKNIEKSTIDSANDAKSSGDSEYVWFWYPFSDLFGYFFKNRCFRLFCPPLLTRQTLSGNATLKSNFIHHRPIITHPNPCFSDSP